MISLVQLLSHSFPMLHHHHYWLHQADSNMDAAVLGVTHSGQPQSRAGDHFFL